MLLHSKDWNNPCSPWLVLEGALLASPGRVSTPRGPFTGLRLAPLQPLLETTSLMMRGLSPALPVIVVVAAALLVPSAAAARLCLSGGKPVACPEASSCEGLPIYNIASLELDNGDDVVQVRPPLSA